VETGEVMSTEKELTAQQRTKALKRVAKKTGVPLKSLESKETKDWLGRKKQAQKSKKPHAPYLKHKKGGGSKATSAEGKK
jgi:hypothetical protein